MQMDIQKLIEQLTLEEKASLCSGLDLWHTKPIERLGIPSIMVADGPHGIRKQDVKSEQLSTADALEATCFPTGCALGSSWDEKLLGHVGEALAVEAKAQQISVVLGPAVNIKRSPLCGRNFEYYSEDPFLSSHLASAYIKGMQSRGVGACIKHFAVNNQETERFTVDVHLSQAALHEIYLASFAYAIKEAKPWTVMSAYNKVGGIHASEHPYLLDEVLRRMWGFEGLVMTDWGANCDRVAGLMATQDLEMPGNGGLNDKKIVEAVEAGTLSIQVLDAAVRHVLQLVQKSIDNLDGEATYDQEAHHELARRCAAECMVLLKNEHNLLPLKQESRILLVGPFAKTPRYQGGGSSHIRPTKLDTLYETMSDYGSVAYAEGFSLSDLGVSDKMEKQALALAKNSDVVVVCAGLADISESEAYDRTTLELPYNQNHLIQELCESGIPVVVTLSNGSAVEMPWAGAVSSILECYLGGQGAAKAVCDILYGLSNPSGKLAETFPLRLEDTPSYLHFPGHHDKVVYAEHRYVGYRYYDAKRMQVLFPFGHGLSYTTFSLSSLEVQNGPTVHIKALLRNTGNRIGKQVVQLYVKQNDTVSSQYGRQLKGFRKVELAPDEMKEVSFTLQREDFAYYDERICNWIVDGGSYLVELGFSSRDIHLTEAIDVCSYSPKPLEVHLGTTIKTLIQELGKEALINPILPLLPFNLEGEDGPMMRSLVYALPIRALVVWSGGVFTETMAQNLVDECNRQNKEGL